MKSNFRKILSMLMVVICTLLIENNISYAQEAGHDDSSIFSDLADIDKDTFFFLGNANTDLSKFQTVTLYIGMQKDIKELEKYFEDYADHIGAKHVAIVVPYGTEDYQKLIKDSGCVKLNSYEVPSIIYVDRTNKDCAYFSSDKAKHIVRALDELRDVISNSPSTVVIKQG